MLLLLNDLNEIFIISKCYHFEQHEIRIQIKTQILSQNKENQLSNGQVNQLTLHMLDD